MVWLDLVFFLVGALFFGAPASQVSDPVGLVLGITVGLVMGTICVYVPFLGLFILGYMGVFGVATCLASICGTEES